MVAEAKRSIEATIARNLLIRGLSDEKGTDRCNIIDEIYDVCKHLAPMFIEYLIYAGALYDLVYGVHRLH